MAAAGVVTAEHQAPADRGPFDVDAYLAAFDDYDDRTDHPLGWKGDPHLRRALTRHNPLLFALVYLPHHLTGLDGTVTLADWHLDLFADAEQWPDRPPAPKANRDAWIAPRESGKSTLLFLVLPLWQAAHGWARFVAALADSGGQARDHLRSFKLELDSNPLLRRDYPDLCAIATKPGTRKLLKDDEYNTIRRSGFVFMARGLDSSVLGMKYRHRRPDLIILDDVEPGEHQYSVDQVRKRLSTLQDVVLPLAESARVVLAGTVTMAESIIHQLVKSVTTREPPAEWLAEERFDVHYYPALYQHDGVWRSIWPHKWPVDWLLRATCVVCQEEHHGDRLATDGVGATLRQWTADHESGRAHPDGQRGKVIPFSVTRTFLKNYQNRPVASGGAYWTPGDIPYGTLDHYGRTLLQVDPAVTDRPRSDFYGFAVASRDPANEPWHVWVRHASRGKLTPTDARARVLALLEEFPDIGVVRVESNQGGDLWAQILHDLPVKLVTSWSDQSKPVRFARAHQDYQAGRVRHTGRFPQAEDEMYGFPNTLHDDVVDAVTGATLYFLDSDRARRRKAGGGSHTREGSYV